MYEPLKEYMENLGYEVYPEIEVGWNKRADIIGRNSPAICIVEMKTSLSMELLDQAIRWIPYAHYIYIAIPERKKDIPVIVRRVLSQHKIGILEVSSYKWQKVHDSLPARFNRPRLNTNWDKYLTPLHKTWDIQGGAVQGGHLTPYKRTIHHVRNYLARQRDWVYMKDILEHCETHYASPKNSLSNALRKFEHDWCETKLHKNKLMFKHNGKGILK